MHRRGGAAPTNSQRHEPSLKERLQRGDVCTGTFLLFLSGGDVVQFLAGLGFDYLILDMEHGAMDSRARAGDDSRGACVRPGAARAGVGGAVQPGVARAGCRRGGNRAASGGASRAVPRSGPVRPIRARGRAGPHDVRRTQRLQPGGRRRGVRGGTQPQHPPVRADRDPGRPREPANILAVPGIDGCLVGTGDLAFSLGFPGQTNHPEVLKAAEAMFDTCRGAI